MPAPVRAETAEADQRSSTSPLRRPIRVNYVITDLKVGGVPLHLYRLATRLPRDEVLPRVISLADEGPVGQRLRDAGVEVHACGARSTGDIPALVRLWRLLQQHPCDVLHALLFHANTAARIVGPLAGVPCRRIITEIQTVECERRWHLLVDGLTCRLSRYEVGNSPSVVAHLHARARIPRSRLRCVRGAVDVEAIAGAPPAERAQLGVAPEEMLILWTGRLDPIKGFEEMLAAFRRFRKSVPAKFILVGEGPYRSVVERLIQECQLSNNVVLAGQRTDIPALLRAADAFLFCSRTEGLPNSLLEAMAASLPIVATDVPGCRDLIVHRRTGLLVPSGSVPHIVEALTRIRNDQAESSKMGRRAQAWVRQHACLDDWVRTWVQAYREVLHSR